MIIKMLKKDSFFAIHSRNGYGVNERYSHNETQYQQNEMLKEVIFTS